MRAKKICIVCGKEFEPRVNNQKCCSPECSDVQKVKRAKASYEKHKHQAKKKEKPKVKKRRPCKSQRGSPEQWHELRAVHGGEVQSRTARDDRREESEEKRKRVCRQA